MIKKTKKGDKSYSVEKKRSGRYAVVGADGKYINGDEKTKILLKEGVIKPPAKKAPAPETAAE